MPRDRDIILTRERSFSAPTADNAVPPPPFECPPVVFPSGVYPCTAASPPQLTDIEQRLLRGMTVSLCMDQGPGSAVTAPYQDCDVWLAHDKEDGFILCVWNYSTGELREVCMMFVTHLLLSSGQKGGDVLTLTCTLVDEESPPPPSSLPGSSSSSTPSSSSSSSTIRFLLQQSSSPSADKFEMAALLAILEAAKARLPEAPPAPATTSGSTGSSVSSDSSKKKRSSVHATTSKRVSLLHRSSGSVGSASPLTTGSGRSSGGSAGGGAGAGGRGAGAGRGLLATAQCGSVRNIFGGMGEVAEEEEEDQ
jgi:hypothetical protein